MALIGHVDQHSRQELQRVDGLGAGGRAVRLVGAIGTALAVRSYVSRSSATGFRAQHRARRVANARSSSDTHTAVCTWNPECGHVSIPAAWSSSNSSRRTKSRSTARRNASVKRNRVARERTGKQITRHGERCGSGGLARTTVRTNPQVPSSRSRFAQSSATIASTFGNASATQTYRATFVAHTTEQYVAVCTSVDQRVIIARSHAFRCTTVRTRPALHSVGRPPLLADIRSHTLTHRSLTH